MENQKWIGSPFCVVEDAVMAALALSGLPCVSVMVTSQPAFLASAVAPLMTAWLRASVATRATMPSFFFPDEPPLAVLPLQPAVRAGVRSTAKNPNTLRFSMDCTLSWLWHRYGTCEIYGLCAVVRTVYDLRPHTSR